MNPTVVPKPPSHTRQLPLNNTEAGAADLPPALPGPAISAAETKELMMSDSARGRELKETDGTRIATHQFFRAHVSRILIDHRFSTHLI